ncbi:hypothetical protein LTR74_018648 [Friedmanniomyces endolithicus]|nr:hypothetical protein LTR74_018648 [Friedmanniomyces endolithicus]
MHQSPDLHTPARWTDFSHEQRSLEPVLSGNMSPPNEVNERADMGATVMQKLRRPNAEGGTAACPTDQGRVDLTPDVLDQLFVALHVQLQTGGGLSGFHIWPSVIIVDDESATWPPPIPPMSFSLARYHILPYFASYLWQLAVFDQLHYVISLYDSACIEDTNRSTFPILQKWHNSKGGNPKETPYSCIKVKTTPAPVNAPNCGIVIWLVAKQLLRGKDGTEAPPDWEREIWAAMDMLNVQRSLDAYMDFD